MDVLEPIEANHDFNIEGSPKGFDVAFAPSDVNLTPGPLNELVAAECGYNIKSIKKKPENGYLIYHKPGKPILVFIVTVGTGDTWVALDLNLRNALDSVINEFNPKNIWIPLMGTGFGKLTVDVSYDVTAKAINFVSKKLVHQILFTLSFPKGRDGESIIARLNEDERNRSSARSLPFRGNFFIGDSIVDSIDRGNEFFQLNKWKTLNVEENQTLLKEVQVGDIIFLKSGGNPEAIEITGIGRITDNYEDKSELEVDWRISHEKISIEGVTTLNKDIEKINSADYEKIIEKIGINRLIERGIFPGYRNNDKAVALLHADTEKGVDYLNVTEDATAFARLIASKNFQPPLAIALFGKWGSGKSFFMRVIRSKITELSASKTTNSYCSGIAHIHFNAWSYMDANLWASLVIGIFEGLNEYIGKNVEKGERKNVEKAISDQLNISKQQTEELEGQRIVLEKQISSLTAEKANLTNVITANISDIKRNTLKEVIGNVNKEFNVEEKIEKALKENDSILKTTDELKKVIPEQYWKDPNVLHSQIRSLRTQIRLIFSDPKNLLWLALILTLFAIPYIFESVAHWLKNMNFTIPYALISCVSTLSIVGTRISKHYKKVQPIFASFWAIKDEYNRKLKEAKSEAKKHETALVLEIETKKGEIDLIDKNLHQTNAAKIELEFRLAHTISTEALHSFIERRNNSDDYKKHLGIISIIRKDFEILNELFIGHNSEFSKKETIQQLKLKFKNPLERIVLYIDDLDRCSEQKVVQVLEAVNLLMAFPLFVVVVGVDPRWVKNSLLKKYQLQFNGKLQGIAELEKIETSNYLEKIFQIPFYLKPATNDAVKAMIRSLAKPYLRTQPPEGLEVHHIIPARAGGERDDPRNLIFLTPEENHRLADGIPPEKRNEINKLEMSETEIQHLQDMSQIVGSNPRAIKRFINTYQLIRSHEGFVYRTERKEDDFLIAMFLLAVPSGIFKTLIMPFRSYLNEMGNHNKKLNHFLNDKSSSEVDLQKHQLNLLMSDTVTFNILQSETCNTYYSINRFVQRFTFEDQFE